MFIRIALFTLFAFASAYASAVPMVFSGTDPGAATTNSDAAFANWAASVGPFFVDNLDGLTGTTGIGGSVTSSLGNTYSTPDDLLGAQNFSFAVLQGTSIRLTRNGPLTELIWDLVRPVDAFGFFSRGNNGGTVTVSFDDGSAQSFTLTAASTNSIGDNLFWGIDGLDAKVAQVTITSTDPGDATNVGLNSNWDRFVYPVPEPVSASLVVLGMAGIGGARRRRSA